MLFVVVLFSCALEVTLFVNVRSVGVKNLRIDTCVFLCFFSVVMSFFAFCIHAWIWCMFNVLNCSFDILNQFLVTGSHS